MSIARCLIDKAAQIRTRRVFLFYNRAEETAKSLHQLFQFREDDHQRVKFIQIYYPCAFSDIRFQESFFLFCKSNLVYQIEESINRMAAAAACKRVGQLGRNWEIRLSGSGVYGASQVLFPAFRYPHLDCRQISQLVRSNGKRLFLVDTLALVRRLEGQGVPSKQAEAITAAITEVLNDSLENVSQSFVSKAEMQKIEMIQDSNLSKFKSEVQNSQGHHFSLLQHETEKLRNDIEKMRNELRFEIDKVTAGQRLDLNLERGRIREELSNQNAETTNLTNKLDREIHALRAHLEAAKYDVIKYCIGTLVSISAVGLAVVRILM